MIFKKLKKKLNLLKSYLIHFMRYEIKYANKISSKFS